MKDWRCLVLVGVVLVILVFALAAVFGRTESVSDILEEVPQQYSKKPEALLKDYRSGELSTEEVVEILILCNIDQVAMPMYDTDPRYDHYYISKRQRDRIEEMKRNLYKQLK